MNEIFQIQNIRESGDGEENAGTGFVWMLYSVIGLGIG